MSNLDSKRATMLADAVFLMIRLKVVASSPEPPLFVKRLKMNTSSSDDDGRLCFFAMTYLD